MQKIESYFISTDHFHELRKIRHDLDFNYINGAIQLKYGDQYLLDITHQDLAFFESVDKVYDYHCHYELNKRKDLKNKIGGSNV